MGIGDMILDLFRPFPPDEGFVQGAAVGKQDTEGTGYWRVGITLAHGSAPTAWFDGNFLSYEEAEDWADSKGCYRNVKIEFQERNDADTKA